MQTVTKVRKVYKQLQKNLGRPPKMAELGTALGVSRERARQLCNRLGISPRAYMDTKSCEVNRIADARAARQRAKDEAFTQIYADICQAALQNPLKTYAEIAEDFGAHPQLVYTLMAYGELGQALPESRTLDRERITALLRTDKTVTEIARLVGASAPIIYRIRRAQKVRAELIRRGVLVPAMSTR